MKNSVRKLIFFNITGYGWGLGFELFYLYHVNISLVVYYDFIITLLFIQYYFIPNTVLLYW